MRRGWVEFGQKETRLGATGITNDEPGQRETFGNKFLSIFISIGFKVVAEMSNIPLRLPSVGQGGPSNSRSLLAPGSLPFSIRQWFLHGR